MNFNKVPLYEFWKSAKFEVFLNIINIFEAHYTNAVEVEHKDEKDRQEFLQLQQRYGERQYLQDGSKRLYVIDTKAET